LVPDRDLVLAQVGDVGLAFQEPQQLVHDRAQVQLLRGHQRETLAQVETQLPAEHAARAGAGAVVLVGAVLEHVAQQVEVLAHLSPPCPGPGPAAGSARYATSRARTGPARPAAGSAAGPWSTSRTRGSRAAHRERARTRRGSGSCRRAARTGRPPRSAGAGGWRTTTGQRTSPGPPEAPGTAARDAARSGRAHRWHAAPAAARGPGAAAGPRRAGRSPPSRRRCTCPTARR